MAQNGERQAVELNIAIQSRSTALIAAGPSANWERYCMPAISNRAQSECLRAIIRQE